ncbi:MAG: hypothetical protein P8K08_23050 [Fuerstiella sp.]|jgi:hypothetical protein|nr:hypothetical protein [Fuerstiella sp.]
MFTTVEQNSVDTFKRHSTQRTGRSVVSPQSKLRLLGLAFLLLPPSVTAEDEAENQAGVSRLNDTLILADGSSQPPLPPSPVVIPDEGVILPMVPVVAEDSSHMVAEDMADFVQLSAVPTVINPYADRTTYNPEIAEPQTQSIGAAVAEHILEILQGPADPLAQFVSDLLRISHDEVTVDLHHNPIPLQPIPRRPQLLIETDNDPFLAPGWLKQGIETPTGAIWRPALWVFGTYRTGINYFDNRSTTNVTEWANRLDLFGQLNLTGTERVVVGVRPVDQEQANRRTFSGYDLRNDRVDDAWNIDVQTLFFEGDFGEIFPRLDPYDGLALDYGFSVGRQPMSFQQGLLLNEDIIDAVTVTRNTLSGNGILNLRTTGVYAWNSIHRNNNMPDPDAQLVGLFTETDIAMSTINADIAYVDSQSINGSLLTVALSGIQRIHGIHNTYNSSLHALTSIPTGAESAASGQGELLFSQFSWTPHHTNDVIYLNTFWAIDRFTSAARGPLAGGPLGQTGVLFSAAGLGNYGAPLSNQATEAIGASLGYQMFFCGTRRQIVFELAGRQDTNHVDQAAIAGGVRYQQAFDQHWLMVLDGFLAKREATGLSPGIRMELQMKF